MKSIKIKIIAQCAQKNDDDKNIAMSSQARIEARSNVMIRWTELIFVALANGIDDNKNMQHALVRVPSDDETGRHDGEVYTCLCLHRRRLSPLMMGL